MIFIKVFITFQTSIKYYTFIAFKFFLEFPVKKYISVYLSPKQKELPSATSMNH